MLDEGTAREIINRVQKLRKKAHLVPTDLITVYYNVNPAGELSRVAKEWNDFIINVLKVPFIDGQAVGNIIIEETQTVIMKLFYSLTFYMLNKKLNIHFYYVSMYLKKKK
jgi:isoleucyl-tRNA synthetase